MALGHKSSIESNIVGQFSDHVLLKDFCLRCLHSIFCIFTRTLFICTFLYLINRPGKELVYCDFIRENQVEHRFRCVCIRYHCCTIQVFGGSFICLDLVARFTRKWVKVKCGMQQGHVWLDLLLIFHLSFR